MIVIQNLFDLGASAFENTIDLPKQLVLTATDADRSAHGNYQAVQTQARATLMTCIQSAGLLEDIPAAEIAQTDRFLELLIDRIDGGVCVPGAD